jgi:hypothetical protein
MAEPLPLTRLGMTLLNTYTKRWPSGKTVTMARIRCACGAVFKSSASKWRNGEFDSCSKCPSRKNQGWGFGAGKLPE